MNIEHELTSGFRPLKITFTIDSVNELVSLRALFGGIVSASIIIANSRSPDAPSGPADTFITGVGSILDYVCDEAGVE